MTTPHEIFWRNFRLMRGRVDGMTRDERRDFFMIVRAGPLLGPIYAVMRDLLKAQGYGLLADFRTEPRA